MRVISFDCIHTIAWISYEFKAPGNAGQSGHIDSEGSRLILHNRLAATALQHLARGRTSALGRAAKGGLCPLIFAWHCVLEFREIHADTVAAALQVTIQPAHIVVAISITEFDSVR